MTTWERILDEADETLELSEEVEIPFRRVPACPDGFSMGARGYGVSEEPRHLVRMSEFWLASVLVTQEQFAEFRANHENHFKGRLLNPAEKVSYDDVAAFCLWAMQQEGWQELKRKILTECSFYDDLTLAIPSEAQWECACRAGTETEYFSGDGEESLKEVGWFGEDWNEGSTHPVAELSGNLFGLYDMHGNVWEWCRDLYDEDAYHSRVDGAFDPEVIRRNGELAGRVLRGGSWGNSAWRCRSAYRDWYWPGSRDRLVGFRLGLFPGPVEQVWPEAALATEAGPGGTPQTGPEWRGEEDLQNANFSPRSGDENSK